MEYPDCEEVDWTAIPAFREGGRLHHAVPLHLREKRHAAKRYSSKLDQFGLYVAYGAFAAFMVWKVLTCA